MDLHMESVKHGFFKDVEYTAYISELPDGKYMAIIASVQSDPEELPFRLVKPCDDRAQALAAIEDAWESLGKGQLIHQFVWDKDAGFIQ